MTLGDRIKALRIKNHMTQEELGEKLGVKKAAVQKYENGTVTNIKKDKIKLLADALETTPSYLMGWDDLDKKFDHKTIAKQTLLIDDMRDVFSPEIAECFLDMLKLNALGKTKVIEYLNDLLDQPKFTDQE